MYKAFMLAGFTIIMVACHDHSKTGGPSTNHGDNQSTIDNHKKGNDMNEIHQTMDAMMRAMHKAEPTGNNDIDFAVMMIEHHRGAVEMSEVEISKGVDQELKAFAQKVIEDQNKEINFMREFVSKGSKTGSSNSTEFQKALNYSMMAMMSDSIVNYHDIDKDFAAQMIPHHQSAVDMAEAYLEFGQDASLKGLCENIIDSQTKEISWLKDWLAKKVE